MFAKYHDGFVECVAEVNRCLTSVEGMPNDLHTRLMSHLSTFLQHRAPPSPQSPNMPPMLPQGAFPVPGSSPVGAFPFPPMHPAAADAAMRSMTSPVSTTSATPAQSLPGQMTPPRSRDSKNSQSHAPAHASFAAGDARVFQASLAHAHSIPDPQERARVLEQLFISNKMAQMEYAMKLQHMRTTEPTSGTKKNGRNTKNGDVQAHANADVIRETLLLRERMLAFGKGDPVWRPW